MNTCVASKDKNMINLAKVGMKRNFEELEETPQGYALVQKAKAIAKKMAGNYSGAVKEIEKLKKGLSGVYEVELALIIGKTCKNITEEQAEEAVFGYMIFNDVSNFRPPKINPKSPKILFRIPTCPPCCSHGPLRCPQADKMVPGS